MEQKAQFKCDACGQSFESRDKLRQHSLECRGMQSEQKEQGQKTFSAGGNQQQQQ